MNIIGGGIEKNQKNYPPKSVLKNDMPYMNKLKAISNNKVRSH